MKFEKGHAKTGGRQSGTANKATAELRQQLQQLVQTALNDLPAVLATMDPVERVRLMAQLLPYVMPKLSNMDINATVDLDQEEPKGATLRAWTAEDVNRYDEWRRQQDLTPALPDSSISNVNQASYEV